MTVWRSGAARRHAWRLTASLLPVVVAASVAAALFGWAARGMPDASSAPSVSSALPDGTSRAVRSTELPVPSSVSEAAPNGVTVADAPFDSLDVSTEGTAALLDVDGKPMLRLTSFTTDPGRGYVVYLVPLAEARSPADGVSLGPLKGATGDQNYAVPVGARLDGPLTVLIWSRGFKGPVAHAALRH